MISVESKVKWLIVGWVWYNVSVGLFKGVGIKGSCLGRLPIESETGLIEETCETEWIPIIKERYKEITRRRGWRWI